MSTSNPTISVAHPITLILSKDSLRNATYDCDASGIHFRVSTPTDGIKLTRLTSVYRWNSHTNEEELVAEWENNTGKMDRFSVRGLTRASITDARTEDGKSSSDPALEFVSREEFLPKTEGGPLTAYGNRTFMGENGRRYTWKVRTSSLKLYPSDGENAQTAIAEYKRQNHVFNKRNAVIEMKPEALEILNSLIVTFIYCERGRRNQEESATMATGLFYTAS